MRKLTPEELKELEAEVEQQSKLLDVLEARLDVARMEAAPFQLGDICQAKIKNKWQPAIIREIRHIGWGGADGYWYKVSLARAGGEWSKAVMHAFGDVRKLT